MRCCLLSRVNMLFLFSWYIPVDINNFAVNALKFTSICPQTSWEGDLSVMSVLHKKDWWIWMNSHCKLSVKGLSSIMTEPDVRFTFQCYNRFGVQVTAGRCQITCCTLTYNNEFSWLVFVLGQHVLSCIYVYPFHNWKLSRWILVFKIHSWHCIINVK